MSLREIKLIVSPVKDPDRNKEKDVYEVCEDIFLDIYSYSLAVPKFFQFDGASVPSVAWRTIGTPFTPRFMIAAVFHDWGYHTHIMSKELTDSMFYDLLIQNGIGETKAGLMKKAVELFGEHYWENDEQDILYLKRLESKIIENNRNPKDYGLEFLND